MSGELMAYNQGTERPTFRDRQVARRGRHVYDEVRLTALQADGAMALSAHIMHGVADLDRLRQQLAGDDPAMAAMLAQFQTTAITQASILQSGLFNRWGL